MDTINNKANVPNSSPIEFHNTTLPILPPLPPTSKFQTSAHKETVNGAPKNFASPQSANQHPGGPESASKSRLITDFLPRIGQVHAPKDRHTNDNAACSTGEDRRTPTDTPGKTNQGNLACHRCGILYPTDPHESIPEPIQNQWECQLCTIELREKLITELKENARFKALEREKRELQKKQEKEMARIKRESEMQQRREAKEQEKEQSRLKRAEQTAQKLVDDNDGSHNNSSKKIVIQTNLPYVVNSPTQFFQQGPIQLLQTTLKVDKKKSRAKPDQPLTPAERQKLDERKLIKQQLLIFSKLYPELVEKNSIKYPIEDGLITKLPELHGATSLKPKPTPHKVLLSGEEFDRLLYIWEFFNNFSEYLETPQFKIEDLKVALTLNTTEETSIVEEEEMDWALQMRLKQIREKGFHLVNSLFTALVSRYLSDMFSTQEEQSENLNQILLSIHKLITDKEAYWPEIVRLLLTSKAGSNFDHAFGQSSQIMKGVILKLTGLNTKDFNFTFNYEEKIALLTSLIDGIHELQEFRNILNQRIEERTQYNKEKMEIYAQIKDLEKEQQEINKKLNDQEIVTKQIAIDKELDELYQVAAQASRADSRKIKERINLLKTERCSNEIDQLRVEEAIKRKHAQIVKINEKSFKCNIRTSMLGKDANKVEYWHFKDDSSRIYTRVEQQVFGDIDQLTGARKVMDCQYNWFYYDQEDQYEMLVESLNPKGIRERKLQENLKKIKDRLKLKKAKKSVASQEEKPDVEMENEESISLQGAGPHLVFETDNYEESLNYAVWFGKKVPPKRRVFGRSTQKLAADEQSDQVLSLDQVKKKLIEVATYYKETSAAHDREWTDKATMELWLNNVTQCNEVVSLRKLITQLDDGMSLPTALLKKEDRIQRFRLQLFKFWPSQDLHDAFRKYTQSLDNNLLAVSISVEILDKINEQFVMRQTEKALKINKKAAEALSKDINKKPQASAKPLQRAYGRGEFVKYFDSSESEEQSNEDEEEAKSEQSEFKASKAPVKGKKPQGRSVKDSSDAKESDDSESSDQESEEAGSREWDEYCYICDDGGNVICCDGCSNVAHLSCLKMKQQPKDDWHCNQCLVKIAQQRVTRGKTTELTKKSSVKSGRKKNRRL